MSQDYIRDLRGTLSHAPTSSHFLNSLSLDQAAYDSLALSGECTVATFQTGTYAGGAIVMSESEGTSGGNNPDQCPDMTVNSQALMLDYQMDEITLSCTSNADDGYLE